MKPKEKAKELISKFYPMTYTAVHSQNTINEYSDAINCALILIDEIINSVENEHTSEYFEKYWEKVKKEILTIKNK